MVNYNISIKKEVYDFLKSLKSANESFSDIILEFKEKETCKKGSKEAIIRFSGALKNKKDWDINKKKMKKFREETESRLR